MNSFLFLIFVHIHQRKMFNSSVLPPCHIAGVYHKHGILSIMLQKYYLYILDTLLFCWHLNHEIALHRSSLIRGDKYHHQAFTQPSSGSTCSNSLSNIGHVKPLKSQSSLDCCIYSIANHCQTLLGCVYTEN